MFLESLQIAPAMVQDQEIVDQESSIAEEVDEVGDK
jgi:hypothetical protein